MRLSEPREPVALLGPEELLCRNCWKQLDGVTGFMTQITEPSIKTRTTLSYYCVMDDSILYFFLLWFKSICLFNLNCKYSSKEHSVPSSQQFVTVSLAHLQKTFDIKHLFAQTAVCQKRGISLMMCSVSLTPRKQRK